LNIATATATEERAYTPREAAQVVKSSCSCAAALTLRAIEEYGLTLYPPRVGGKCWLAYYHGAAMWAHDDNVISVVEKMLRQIGGTQ